MQTIFFFDIELTIKCNFIHWENVQMLRLRALQQSVTGESSAENFQVPLVEHFKELNVGTMFATCFNKQFPWYIYILFVRNCSFLDIEIAAVQNFS